MGGFFYAFHVICNYKSNMSTPQSKTLQELAAEYLDYLLKTKRMSAHTVAAYKNDLTQFQEFLSQEAITDLISIKSYHIRSFMSQMLEQNITPRSVHRKISSIRGWFKYLRKNGLLKTDPLMKVVLPKMPKTLVKDIPAADLMAMFNRFPWNEEEQGDRDRLLLLLFYTTGMRLSELIGLKTSDIDLFRHTFKVLGKRNKERLIPIHPETEDILRDYLNKHKSQYLFELANQQPLYPVYVYRLVNKYLKLFSHASKTSPHVLRHSFATHMLNNGANLMAIKDILGHANLSATQVYTKNSFEKLKKVHQLHPRK